MTTNKRAGRIGSLLLVLCTLLVGATPDKPVRTRTVAFTYQTVISALPPNAVKVELWLPVPHDSPFQTITDLMILCPYPYKIDSAQYRNRVLHISVNNPAPVPFTVSMHFTAVRKEHTQEQGSTTFSQEPPETDSDMARWRQPDQLVPIDGNVKRWAQALVDSAGAKTDLEKARAIYNHIIKTVKYDKTGTGWGRGDIYYACDARRGNCTDFHAIFIGYCRAVGIPARFAIGFSLPTDRPSGQISGYHCWAEFYSKRAGWVPIDASEAAKNPAKREYYFGTHDENRIEFTVGRDLKLYPNQAEPLNYFIYPYAEVDGKPFTNLTNVFSYHDVKTGTAEN